VQLWLWVQHAVTAGRMSCLQWALTVLQMCEHTHGGAQVSAATVCVPSVSEQQRRRVHVTCGSSWDVCSQAAAVRSRAQALIQSPLRRNLAHSGS
jgi:hypothetical protein